MSKKYLKLLSWITIIFLSSLVIFPSLPTTLGEQAASMDPGNPVFLWDDVAEGQLYVTDSADYYYRVIEGLSGNWNIAWLAPTSASNSYNLYLYSDASYSDLVTYSSSSEGLEWVIFDERESDAWSPKVYVPAGQQGGAYIESDTDHFLARGLVQDGALNVTNCIDIYSISLYPTKHYNINLTVPETADYDLYLYHITEDAVAWNRTQYSNQSCTRGMGTDEGYLEFTHSYTDTGYVVLIVRYDGSGAYSLTYEYTADHPTPFPLWAYILIGSLIVIAAAGLVSVKIRSQDNRHKPPGRLSPPIDLGSVLFPACAVCRLPIHAQEVYTTCPHCRAPAHTDHFEEWVKVKGMCPQCQSKI